MKIGNIKGFTLVSILLLSILFFALLIFVTTYSVGTYNYTIEQKVELDTTSTSPSNISISGESKVRLEKYGRLKKEEAFLKAETQLLKEDSIVLIVSIPDSTIALSIKGMDVHKVKATKLSYGGVFDVTSDSVLAAWISTPFKVDSFRSTVIKEQFSRREAPKDTAEANAISTDPVAIQLLPVYFSYYCSRGLQLDIFQSEVDTITPMLKQSGNTIFDNIDVLKEVNFLKNQRKIGFGDAIGALFGRKSISYRPWVEMEIPHSDALIIFRATPYKCKIALKLK